MFPYPTHSGRRRCQRLAVVAAVALWTVAVSAGWCMITDYSYKAEPSGAAPADAWPAGVTLARDANRPTMVVFLHPKCPCSQATLTELERLQSRPTGLGVANVLLVVTIPADADASWRASPLIERGQSLCGSQIVFDRGGVVAGQFGATASGTVMLFNAAGQRLFAGGVTASRGHEGQNAGADAVASLLAGQPAEVNSIPVFGCRLVTSSARRSVH